VLNPLRRLDVPRQTKEYLRLGLRHDGAGNVTSYYDSDGNGSFHYQVTDELQILYQPNITDTELIDTEKEFDR